MNEYTIIKKISTENKDIFTKLLDFFPHMFFIIKNNKCIYTNKFLTNLLGFDDTSELIGRDLNDLIHPDCIQKNLKIQKTIIDLKDISLTYEQKFISKNGKNIDVELTSTFLKYDNEDAILIIVKDIGENKKWKKEIKKNKEFLETINENMTTIIAQTDLKGNFLYINGPYKEYLGYNMEDLLYKNVFHFLHINDRPNIAKEFEEMIRLDINKTVECTYIKKDNTTIFLEIQGKLMHDEYDKKSGIIFCAKDISERKRAEELDIKVKQKTKLLDEAMKSDNLKNEFFSNISHEFKTPLNVILGAVQMINLLLKNPLYDNNTVKINNYLGSIKQNSYRLIRLINNLIDITKIDSAYFKINLINRDIVSIVENITLSVADYIKDNGIELIFDTFIEEKIIACDPDKIERIMLNLLSNAIKFTDEGGSIFVTMSEENENIIISVKDTGIGIPEDKTDLVFHRFIQADKSFTRNNEGSGIGLSIVKSLVEMHEGTIEINKNYKNGTEFIFKIPAKVLNNENINAVEKNFFEKIDNKENIKIEFSDIYFTNKEK